MSEQDLEKVEDNAEAEEGANETPEQAAESPTANTDAEAAGEDVSVGATASELETALAEATQKAQNYFDGWQRERADFSNYKKRAERDLLTMRFNAKVDTLKGLLPVLDDFERAMENMPEDQAENPWLDGIRAIQRKLQKTLADEGIQAVDPVGESFDPNLHEAIGRESDTDMESGLVTATLQKGYMIGDRVLRPALVRVAE